MKQESQLLTSAPTVIDLFSGAGGMAEGFRQEIKQIKRVRVICFRRVAKQITLTP